MCLFNPDAHYTHDQRATTVVLTYSLDGAAMFAGRFNGFSCASVTTFNYLRFLVLSRYCKADKIRRMSGRRYRCVRNLQVVHTVHVYICDRLCRYLDTVGFAGLSLGSLNVYEHGIPILRPCCMYPGTTPECGTKVPNAERSGVPRSIMMMRPANLAAATWPSPAGPRIHGTARPEATLKPRPARHLPRIHNPYTGHPKNKSCFRATVTVLKRRL